MSLNGQTSTTPTHPHHRLEPVVRFVTAQIAKQQLTSARLERSFFPLQNPLLTALFFSQKMSVWVNKVNRISVSV